MDNVVIEPEYGNEPQKQVFYLQINNKGQKRIIFKMKSTQPQVLRFRPVFGLIPPSTKKRVKIYRNGEIVLPRNSNPKDQPHLTILLAPAPTEERPPSSSGIKPAILPKPRKDSVRPEWDVITSNKNPPTGRVDYISTPFDAHVDKDLRNAERKKSAPNPLYDQYESSTIPTPLLASIQSQPSQKGPKKPQQLVILGHASMFDKPMEELKREDRVRFRTNEKTAIQMSRGSSERRKTKRKKHRNRSSKKSTKSSVSESESTTNNKNRSSTTKTKSNPPINKKKNRKLACVIAM